MTTVGAQEMFDRSANSPIEVRNFVFRKSSVTKIMIIMFDPGIVLELHKSYPRIVLNYSW